MNRQGPRLQPFLRARYTTSLNAPQLVLPSRSHGAGVVSRGSNEHEMGQFQHEFQSL
jgi:hypothetical protein